MISLEHKFIFIHIPRTGGTTIQYLLNGFSEENAPKTPTIVPCKYISNLAKEKQINIINYTHFTAKSYLDILGEDYFDYKVFTFVRDPIIKSSSLQRFNGHAIGSTITPDMEWAYLQKRYVVDDSNNSIVDRIFRYEDFDNEVFEMFDWLNLSPPCPLPPPVLNSTNEQKRNTCSYDENKVNELKELFKEDMDYFNYE
jgi:hypothetical protein